MTSDEILNHLDVEGYAIIEGVIPASEIVQVRENVAAGLRQQREEAEEKASDIRSKGHRIGGAGIQALPGIINDDQSFAPYLTDDRIINTLQSLFGDYHRITGMGAIANHPDNDRGYWHADWPYNQTNAAHIPAPYADTCIKLSSLWMLTEFNAHTGGTLVIPGSHRSQTNPSSGDLFDREAQHPAELQISAPAGSVMLFDSRLWHCVAKNHSDEPRYAINVSYAVWWLNLQPTRLDSAEYTQMVVETNGKPNVTPLIPASVFDSLPTKLQSLLRHWVEN